MARVNLKTKKTRRTNDVQTLKVANAISLENVAMEQRKWDGKDYLVAPVVLLVEGVHNEFYYPAEEMKLTAHLWNGVDVPVLHPQDEEGNFISVTSHPKIIEDCCIGRLWNVRYEEGDNTHPPRLKGEVWIDREKLNKISPESFELMATDKMEVSTGLIATEDGLSGAWKDESYLSTLSGFIPDHLALLPGEFGACSREDGCGIRANKFTKGADRLAKLDLFLNESLKKIELNFLSNKESFGQVKEAIQAKLNGMDQPNKQPVPLFHYLESTYDDYFIYEVMGSDGNGLFKLNYTINENGEAEFSGDPVPIKRVQSYEEIKTNKRRTKSMSNGKECCAELIDALIANEATQYTEDHRGMLEELPEDVLKVMAEVPKVEKEEETDPTDETVTEPSNEEAIQAAVEKRIANDPIMQEQKRLYDQKKESLIQGLLANKRNEFTEEELKAKDIRELERLSSLAQVDPDYSMNVASQAEEKIENEMPKESDLYALKAAGM